MDTSIALENYDSSPLETFLDSEPKTPIMESLSNFSNQNTPIPWLKSEILDVLKSETKSNDLMPLLHKDSHPSYEIHSSPAFKATKNMTSGKMDDDILHAANVLFNTFHKLSRDNRPFASESQNTSADSSSVTTRSSSPNLSISFDQHPFPVDNWNPHQGEHAHHAQAYAGKPTKAALTRWTLLQKSQGLPPTTLEYHQQEAKLSDPNSSRSRKKRTRLDTEEEYRPYEKKFATNSRQRSIRNRANPGELESDGVSDRMPPNQQSTLNSRRRVKPRTGLSKVTNAEPNPADVIPRPESNGTQNNRKTKRNSLDYVASTSSNKADQAASPTKSSQLHDGKVCGYCGATCTPMWRHGPPSCPDLCNKCGVKYMRGRLL